MSNARLSLHRTVPQDRIVALFSPKVSCKIVLFRVNSVTSCSARSALSFALAFSDRRAVNPRENRENKRCQFQAEATLDHLFCVVVVSAVRFSFWCDLSPIFSSSSLSFWARTQFLLSRVTDQACPRFPVSKKEVRNNNNNNNGINNKNKQSGERKQRRINTKYRHIHMHVRV